MKILQTHHFAEILREANDNCIARAYELGKG
jgi:hypothetical protein